MHISPLTRYLLKKRKNNGFSLPHWNLRSLRQNFESFKNVSWLLKLFALQRLGLVCLTHFRPMLHLCRNQVVGRWPSCLLKMSLFHTYFSNILLVKTNYLVYPWVGSKMVWWWCNKFSLLVEHWSKMVWWWCKKLFLFSWQ